MKGWKKGLSLSLLLLALVAQASEELRHLGPLALEGQWQQGGMVIGRAPQGTQVWINEQPLRIGAGGEFVFGFNRDEGSSVRLRWQQAGEQGQGNLTVAARKYDIQRVDGVASKYVTPDPKVAARIKEDNRKVAVARSRDDARLDFLPAFIWPAQGRVSGVYGSQRIFNGEPRNPHFGLDIAAPAGAAVVAPAAGVVSLAEPDLYFSGGTLIVDHGHGINSTFIHLSAIDVKPGQRVTQGQTIGKVGSTGRSTGPHLDWRVNWFQVRLDPALLVPPRP